MPAYTGEDAWLFAGETFDGCSNCGRSECEGCNDQRPKWLPTTNIIVIHTGAPTVLLFDNDSLQMRFVFGGDCRYDRTVLRRYDEAWERITPHQGKLVAGGYEAGLKIRYLDHENKPAAHETAISTVTRKFVIESKSHKYFALSVRRGDGTSYSLFGGDGNNAWRLNLFTGECTTVTNLRIDDGCILYSDQCGDRCLGPDSIFDYGTGERIAHSPSAMSVMARS